MNFPIFPWSLWSIPQFPTGPTGPMRLVSRPTIQATFLPGKIKAHPRWAKGGPKSPWLKLNTSIHLNGLRVYRCLMTSNDLIWGTWKVLIGIVCAHFWKISWGIRPLNIFPWWVFNMCPWSKDGSCWGMVDFFRFSGGFFPHLICTM